MSKQVALITGASSGIGTELARELAKRGYDLVLSGRNAAALQKIADELAAAHGGRVLTVVADLAQSAGTDAVLAFLNEKGIAVDILANNAGLGFGSDFAAAAPSAIEETVQVNVAALTRLTRALLPGMIERRRGRVLNVASTAAFQPGPGMAVYYATKAYVLSLSEALAHELRGSGVSVTALCPGPTTTGFQARAAIEETRLMRGSLMPVADAASVAKAGVEGMLAGRRVVIPGLMNRLGALSAAVTPRAISLPLIAYLQR